MGGSSSSSLTELRKGSWTREEDHKLVAYIQEHGRHGSWRTLPSKAGLQRCGKSCRLRWANYLRPDIKRGKFTTHEEKTIIRLHALFGNRWSSIAAHLPMRTDNEIKNYWNTRLKKRLIRLGIDPVTHKPKSNPARARHAATLSHMAQWEAARLEGEARESSKLLYKPPLLRKTPSPPPPPPYLAATRPCLDVLKVWQSTSNNIPSSFFRPAPAPPANNLESSPTSALNFSFTAAAPTLTPIIVSSSSSNENEYQMPLHQNDDDDHHAVKPSAPLDLASFNQDPPLVGELEDDKSYWNYLLNQVSSPMMESQSPALFWG